MPTGVAIRDAREQLFDAAERILLRDGVSALTSRAVTTEANVAKGVLHRHFADFDAFLAEFVHDRAHQLTTLAAALLDAAGTGSVIDNITAALSSAFTSVAAAMLPLIVFRDELRARLRQTWPTGIPVANEVAAMVRAYLAAERDLGRVAADAEIDTVTLLLIGSGQLVHADGDSPETMVRRVVAAAVTPVLP